MLLTGDGIVAFRLLTIRQGLKIESMGMRLTSKAPSCRSIVKREFGITGKNIQDVIVKYDDFLRSNGLID